MISTHSPAIHKSSLATFRRGSALVVSMFITVIIILAAIYLLDKIVPVSRNVKGVEYGNIAYYQASSSIESALLAMSGAHPEYETGATNVHNGLGYTFSVRASGTAIPESGKGTSEYDANWNAVGMGRPLQLTIPGGVNWSNVAFRFRVPDINMNKDNTDETLSGTTTPIIAWLLSGSGKTLISASGSQMIRASEINGNDLTIGARIGISSVGSQTDFQSFYNSMDCTTNRCNLKLAVLNPPVLSNPPNTPIPYIEYQMSITSPNPSIPLQYATIESEWFAGGFRQTRTRKVQQTTTSEAMNFTVFQ